MKDRRAAESGAAVVSEAYGAARELLRQAEEDAARIRGEADRYRRQREQEAELIVAKARRLLTMAEARIAEPPDVVDLDAPPVRDLPDDEPVRPVARGSRNALDSIVATAVSNAIHRALPADG